MSFALPSVKVQPTQIASFDIHEGAFGIADPFSNGLGGAKSKLGSSHPLESSERNYLLNQEKMNLNMLRNIQGLHAPLKLTMELKAVNKVGRLPFLESSNALRDSLTGNDLNIGFEDILNTAEFREQMGQPHAVVERSLGIL